MTHIRTASITVQGQIVVRNMAADGIQEMSPETWAEFEPIVGPIGFWHDGTHVHIPGELCPWWAAVLRGASEEEASGLWPAPPEDAQA